MASSIGVRIYQVTLRKSGDRKDLQFGIMAGSRNPAEFTMSFPKRHSNPSDDADRQRSWYFQEKENNAPTSSIGHIRYGTYGFESDFVDAKTKRRNYRRKTSDIEEIPLFYEFWHPKGSNYALAAFQSFQGRSCIELVSREMINGYEKFNPGYILHFKKLVPTDSFKEYKFAPVKKVRFIKRNAPADLAAKYMNTAPDASVDIEIGVSAKRKGVLGTIDSITNGFSKSGSGVLIDDAVFEQAVAEVQIGKRRRQVGLLSHNGDYGVIDLSDSVKRAADGHPAYESIKKESDDLLKEFHSMLNGNQL